MINDSVTRVSTGVAGLDKMLHGGFISQRAYLVRGGPGSGKTTLGLHFLSSGAERQQKALFISLIEPEKKIKYDAQTRGFNLEGIEFLDLSPSSELITEEQGYDIFLSGEVEQEPLIKSMITKIEELQPKLIFLDSLTQLRHLSADTFQFRQQVLSFIKFAIKEGATVLVSSEASSNLTDDDLQFISDGVINLDSKHGERHIEISKLRGSDFSAGQHSMTLGKAGIKVFPRIKPSKTERQFKQETISSGVPEVDELLHGGIERGTDTIISGPSGVGKTTLGIQFMKEAAGRGENSIIYIFEKGVETLLSRCEAINIPVRRMVKRGTLKIEKINPLEYTPQEFAALVRNQVKELEAQIVMLDSIAGYRLSFKNLATQEEEMVRNLHSLSEYLTNLGVTVLLINEIENITGNFRATDHGISYLADNLIFLRYLEVAGKIEKAIGVLKKRLSDFEKNLRSFRITEYGIKVGQPLSNLRGILSGSPEFVDLSEGKENN